MSEFQSRVAKPRTSRGHKNLLDGGRKDLIKHGQPFNQSRPVDKSNAFLAKENTGLESEALQHFLDSAAERGVYGEVDFSIFLKILKQDGVSEAVQYVTTEMSDSDAGEGMDIGDLLDDLDEELHKTLREFSAMGTGAIAGHVGKKPRKKKREGIQMQSRQEIVNEIKVRNTITNLLNLQVKRYIKKSLNTINENLKLRKIVSSLISESDVEKSPHKSTAVNILDQVFGKIKKNIEDGYKMLTTEKDQRDSYRRHLLSAVDDALRAEEVNIEAASDIDTEEPLEDLAEVEINIKQDSDPLDVSDEEKVLPNAGDQGGDTEEPAEEKSEEEEFGIEGEELTGRDQAFPVFKQILEPIISGYKSLHNSNDREVYHDYLLTNMKMLMDQFEDQLSGIVDEPESDSYNPDADAGISDDNPLS